MCHLLRRLADSFFVSVVVAAGDGEDEDDDEDDCDDDSEGSSRHDGKYMYPNDHLLSFSS